MYHREKVKPFGGNTATAGRVSAGGRQGNSNTPGAPCKLKATLIQWFFLAEKGHAKRPGIVGYPLFGEGPLFDQFRLTPGIS